jgi:hypothetical protein
LLTFFKFMGVAVAKKTEPKRPPILKENSDSQGATSKAYVLKAEDVVAPTAVTPPWPVRKDSLITYLAIFVIGSAACCSVIALLLQTIFPDLRPSEGDNWAIDMLTLALVSSPHIPQVNL